MILSIVIPCFERPKALVSTLKSLLAGGVPGNIEIVALDNASQPPLKEIWDTLQLADDTIRWEKNAANIGLAANLLRGIELAKGEWVWLLGDDDCPFPGAIELVIAEITAAQNSVGFLKFNSSNGGAENRRLISGMEELANCAETPGFYSNLIFISSGLFRRRDTIAHLGAGYHWAYSLTPQLALIFGLIASGKAISLIPRDLVTQTLQEEDQQWNRYRMLAGFPSLGDYEASGAFLATAMPAISRRLLGERPLLRMLRLCLTDVDRPPAQWRHLYIRHASLIGGAKGLLMATVAWMLPFMHEIKFLRKAVKRRCGETRSAANLNRS